MSDEEMQMNMPALLEAFDIDCEFEKDWTVVLSVN